MTANLTSIHMLAGFAAELNEVEGKLHEALQTVVGIRSQVLYEISAASRTVDPEAPVDQGALAPGKPPRPTEGGVAVTEGPQSPEEGGEGSADRCPGARVAGFAAVMHQADQALDGASLGEGTPRPDDPRPVSDADTVLALYEGGTYTPQQIADLAYFSVNYVLGVLRTARREGDRRVAAGDLTRYLALPDSVKAMIVTNLGDLDEAEVHL